MIEKISIHSKSSYFFKFRPETIANFFNFSSYIHYCKRKKMKEKTDNSSRSLKWEQNGELAHKDLSELIERLKNVESEHTSSELSRLGTKSNIKE